MTITWPWLAVACIVAAAVGLLFARSPFARLLCDVPNERSLHVAPRPRVGGLGIIAASLPAMAWAGVPALMPVVACAALLAAVSLLDDVRSLPIEVRLPSHAIAALVVVLASPLHAHGAWFAIAAILAIVWMTNLYNFMDGADGLAGGMAVIGFAALAWAAWPADAALAWAAATVASASLGFLAINFPPARVFMGDAGSIPLGFLAGAMSWLGVVDGTWPAWFPLLVFSPFVADATVTLLRRAWRREAIWRAHRSHYYQRLVLHGWSKRQLALLSYVLMAAAAASACVALRQDASGAYAIIAAWTAIYAALFAAIDRHTRSHGEPRASPPGIAKEE
jgi:UDP-N-acetylmuramyl pentapeptide phosphotransferase/UDP-N-acetylglucosamine-1-phosphate transferase